MSSFTAIPINITGLSDREAVHDTLSRCLEGFDTNNKELFVSAFDDTEEGTFDLNGTEIKGLDNILSQTFASVGAMDTTHIVSSERIFIEGDNARVTATAIANHFRPGEGPDPSTHGFLAGSTYEITLFRAADGLWKIKLWKLRIKWTSGDPSVMGF